MRGVAKLADRAGFAARKEESTRRGMLRGLGIGTATLYAGSMSTGQGIETTLTDLVARELGVSRDAMLTHVGPITTSA
jgi:carbon-monoxide dehydrogenase large subunit